MAWLNWSMLVLHIQSPASLVVLVGDHSMVVGWKIPLQIMSNPNFRQWKWTHSEHLLLLVYPFIGDCWLSLHACGFRSQIPMPAGRIAHPMMVFDARFPPRNVQVLVHNLLALAYVSGPEETWHICLSLPLSASLCLSLPLSASLCPSLSLSILFNDYVRVTRYTFRQF